MEARYVLTPNQVAVLRALSEGIVELSAAEIAVYARLLPNQVSASLDELEHLGLVHSWHPATGRTGERLHVLTSEGQTVLRGLSQFRGTPPVGTVVQLPGLFPSLSGWLPGRQNASQVVIVSESER